MRNLNCLKFKTARFNLSEAGVSPVIQCSFHTFLIMNSYMKSLLSGFVNKLQKTPISGFQEVKCSVV
jgi:hypothetical protein